MNLFTAAGDFFSCSPKRDKLYDARTPDGFYGVRDLDVDHGKVTDLVLIKECQASRTEYPRRLRIPIVQVESVPCYHVTTPFDSWWSKL